MPSCLKPGQLPPERRSLSEPHPLPVFLQPLLELMLKSGLQLLLRYSRLPDQRGERHLLAGMMLQKDTHRISRIDLCLSRKLTIYNSLFNNDVYWHRAGLKAYTSHRPPQFRRSPKENPYAREIRRLPTGAPHSKSSRLPPLGLIAVNRPGSGGVINYLHNPRSYGNFAPSKVMVSTYNRPEAGTSDAYPRICKADGAYKALIFRFIY